MARRPAAERSSGTVARSQELSALLRSAREDANLSRQRVAELANVSVGSIARIEQGLSPEPGLFMVARISGVIRQHLGKPQDATFEKKLRRIVGL